MRSYTKFSTILLVLLCLAFNVQWTYAAGKKINLDQLFGSLEHLGEGDTKAIVDEIKAVENKCLEPNVCIPRANVKHAVFVGGLVFVIVFWLIAIISIVLLFLCCRTNTNTVSEIEKNEEYLLTTEKSEWKSAEKTEG